MSRQGDDLEAQLVLGVLGRGRENAVSLGELAEDFEWPRRVIERAVQTLRIEGHPVCSNTTGIWLGDVVDVEATYRQLRHRIVSQSVTAWAVRSTLRRMRAAAVQQTTLFGEAA